MPRVAAALAAFECEAMQIHSLASGPGQRISLLDELLLSMFPIAC